MKPSIWGKLVLLGDPFIWGCPGSPIYWSGQAALHFRQPVIKNLTSPVVALLGIQLLKENLSRRQWLGVFNSALAGVLVFLDRSSSLPTKYGNGYRSHRHAGEFVGAISAGVSIVHDRFLNPCNHHYAWELARS